MPSDPATQYARDVVGGKIPSTRYHRLACQRHLDDLARIGSPDFPYTYDPTQGQRFVTFLSKFRHSTGKWAGQTFSAAPFQIFCASMMFGWRTSDGTHRRFTTATIFVPRKNAKTTLAAAIALYATFFEGEPGAQGFVIATKEAIARICFGIAQQMVRANAKASRRLIVRAKVIEDPKTNSLLTPLGQDSKTEDGRHPAVVIVDEFHAHPDRSLLNVMESGMGAREAPLTCIISTAGSNILGAGGQEFEHCQRLLNGHVRDDSTERYFAVVCAADADADPYDEQVWIAANPMWDISVSPEWMRRYALRAKQSPDVGAEFATKTLNIWTTASTPWLNLHTWGQGQTTWGEDLRARLVDAPRWVGLDLASHIDLLAVVELIRLDDTLILIPTFFAAEDGIEERERRDRVPYRAWVEQGYLRTTPGSRIDYDAVHAHLASIPNVQVLGYDPWNTRGFIERVHEYIPEERCVEVPQNFRALTASSKEFHARVQGGLVDAGNHPIMTWCVGNTVAQEDSNGNVKPSKAKSRGRIDGVVAAIIGLVVLSIPVEEQAYASPEDAKRIFG